MKQPGLFLDRDGVINREVGYLHRFEDVTWVDGIVPLIQRANSLDYFVAVVTNQAGIGRGYYTESQFHELMNRMRHALVEQGARIDAVYFSPFHPVHGIGNYRQQTDCRKPGPGMLVRAAAEHDLDLTASVMVGDRCSDMHAGSAAGLTRLFLLYGTEEEPCDEPLHVKITDLSQVNLRPERAS